MTTLIIAEKAKAAKAIAEALGAVKSIKKSKYLYIYHIPLKEIYVIPLRGHILGYKNTKKYKSWTATNPRDIITDPMAIEKVPTNYAFPYINALKEYAKICDHCIIGTDADIEGCNIGLYDAFPFIKRENNTISISQMWLSSLQKNEIIQKYKNTITPKWSWGETGEARAIIDAIIGFSATREVTNTLRPLLKKFNVKFTSIGRVQTSLLYLIYLREMQIKKFISEPYYTIEANLINQNNIIKVNHQSNPFKKEDDVRAKDIYQKIKNEKFAKIIKNTKSTVKRKPPTPLNTSVLLILLTRTLKISANQAFNTMNALYLNQIISYPRTDSDVYKDNFNHIDFLNKSTTHSEFGAYSSILIKKNRIKPTKGKKDAGDHPPITPLESLELNSSRFENNLQRKVYNILTRLYLALFGDDATESKTILNVLIKDEPFVGRFVSLISDGFLKIAPFLRPKYDTEIEIIGNTLAIDKIACNSKETQPPPRYTDTTLLQLMERNHLGTKATRPVIIQLLEKRELISRTQRRYSLTELGIFLIDNLKDIWLPFLDPKFTKRIELLLEEIKEERKTIEEIVENVRLTFLDLFDKFIANKKQLIEKMDKVKVKPKEFPLTTSNCPFCNSAPMKLITTYKKKRFLACSNENCEIKYLNLPNKGRVYILESRCKACGFNIFKINTRKGNKTYSYHICPKCWNEGLTNKSGKGFCSKCEHYKIVKGVCVKK